MKILFADDGAEIRELVKLTLESYLDVTVDLYSDGESLISSLEKSKIANSLERVIVTCDYNMPNGNGMDVYNYIVKNNLEHPFILMSSEDPLSLGISDFFSSKRTNVYVRKPEEVLALYQTVEKVYQSHYNVICRNVGNDYAFFSSKFIFKLGKPIVDYYYSTNGVRFVKVFSKEDDEAQDVLRGLQDENKKLYIHRDDLSYFFKEVYRKFNDALLDKAIDDVNINECSAVEFSKQMVQLLGVNQKIVEFAATVVQSVLQNVAKNKGLTNIIDATMLKDDHFLFKHSVLVAYLAISILSRSPWNSNSAEIKLCIAALFHDLMLSEDDYDEFEFDLEIQDQESYPADYLSHPQVMSKLFQKLDMSYGDVAKIIEQHHERPDGSGFPRALHSNHISNLAAIFIVAELIANQLVNGKSITELMPWYTEIKAKFNEGVFRKVFVAAESVFIRCR